MSKELIATIRKRRELTVKVGNITFTARRPTDVEAVSLHRNGSDYVEIARRSVSGWEGVTENDVAGGGGTDIVPFSADLWSEWLDDRPDLWQPIAHAVLEAYRLHYERAQADGKN